MRCSLNESAAGLKLAVERVPNKLELSMGDISAQTVVKREPPLCRQHNDEGSQAHTCADLIYLPAKLARSG